MSPFFMLIYAKFYCLIVVYCQFFIVFSCDILSIRRKAACSLLIMLKRDASHLKEKKFRWFSKIKGKYFNFFFFFTFR